MKITTEQMIGIGLAPEIFRNEKSNQTGNQIKIIIILLKEITYLEKGSPLFIKIKNKRNKKEYITLGTDFNREINQIIRLKEIPRKENTRKNSNGREKSNNTRKRN